MIVIYKFVIFGVFVVYWNIDIDFFGMGCEVLDYDNEVMLYEDMV